MLSGPEIARLLDQFETGYLTAEDPDNLNNSKNHEIGQATQKTFQKQVNNLCDTIKCMGNPFLDDFPELVTLDSRDCVEPEVAESVRDLEGTGKAQYQAFVKDVVTARTKSIHDTIKKNNLSLFKRSGKKKSANQGKKIKVLANNVSLFAQLYVAMQIRDGDLDEFFSHEIQSFPPSLSDLGNLYLPGTKSELLKCLVPQEHSDPPMRYHCRVLDGAVIVHSLPTSVASTFDEYADLVFLPYVLSQLQHSPRVDIVWDTYSAESQRGKSADKEYEGRWPDKRSFRPTGRSFCEIQQTKLSYLGSLVLKLQASVLVSRKERLYILHLVSVCICVLWYLAYCFDNYDNYVLMIDN